MCGRRSEPGGSHGRRPRPSLPANGRPNALRRYLARRRWALWATSTSCPRSKWCSSGSRTAIWHRNAHNGLPLKVAVELQSEAHQLESVFYDVGCRRTWRCKWGGEHVQRKHNRIGKPRVLVFRLNGFLTIRNFVIHPERGNDQRTDVDILGVRFPHRSELFPNT